MTVEEVVFPVYRVTLTGEDLRMLVFEALATHLGATPELDGSESIHIYIATDGHFADEEDDNEFSDRDYTLESSCSGPKVRFVVPVDTRRARQATDVPVLAVPGAPADRFPPAG